MPPCEQCGEDDDLMHTCSHCQGKFCRDHHLPENHKCSWAMSLKTLGPDFRNLDSDGEKGGALEPDSEGSSDTGAVSVDVEGEGWTSPEPAPIADRSRFVDSDPNPSRSRVYRGLFIIAMLAVAVFAGGQLGLHEVTTTGDYTSQPGGDDAPVAPAAANESNVDQATETPVATTTAAPTPTATPEPELEASRVETLVHEYINEERSERGLPTLTFDNDLKEIARYHSEDMGDRGYFSHTSPDGESMGDRYDKFGYDCRVDAGGNRYYTGSENIAYTYYQERIVGGEYHDSPKDVARGLVDQWMDSPGHRENILMPKWGREGIGIYITETSEGTVVYATQNFC